MIKGKIDGGCKADMYYNKVMNAFLELPWRQPKEFFSTYLKLCVCIDST